MEFDTTYMSKDQIAYLTSWPDQTKWPEGAVRCPRCLGSGRYSFNPRDGYKCFWCACIGHDGYILPSSPYYSWVASQQRFEVRGIGCTLKTDDHQKLVSLIEKACELANARGCQDMPIRVVDWEFDDIVEYHHIDGAWRKACLTPPPPQPEPDPSVCKHCGVHIDFTYRGELICEECIKRHADPYGCKGCGKPVERTIEGELICNDCWTLSQMSDEDIEHAKQVERMLTHCNSDNCEARLVTAIEKREKFCQSCLDEMAATDPVKKCEDCGWPVDEPDDKYCDSCHEKRHKQYWDNRHQENTREISAKHDQLRALQKANPNHDGVCSRFDCTVCEQMRVLNRELERLGEEWVRIDFQLQAYY